MFNLPEPHEIPHGKTHWIVMGGIKECLPAHCDAYMSHEDAVGAVENIYDVCIDDDYVWFCDRYSYPALLRETPVSMWGYDFDGLIFVPLSLFTEREKEIICRQDEVLVSTEECRALWDKFEDLESDEDVAVKGAHLFGNEYVSIEPCTCGEPWIHSEMVDQYQIQEWLDWLDEEDE